jgi:hypothetical protein
MPTPTLKEIVGSNNKAKFSHYRDGNLWYIVEVDGKNYNFPISNEEAKGGTFLAEHKAVTLMRWIRKALDGNTFQLAK